MTNEVKLHLNPFIYPDLTRPNGALPKDMRAQACWYFYTIAETARVKVGKGPSTQIILEDELWLETHYVEQAKSVATLYGLESPDEFAKFWPYVMTQARVLGLNPPHEDYMKLRPSPLIIPPNLIN